MYILPDSSVVWMEPGSKLKFPKAFNEDRRIWLSGNSLFDVYKHKGSTFRVYIEKAFIEVKGTSFRIQQNSPQDSYITLFNGKIEFNIESSNQKIVMKPLQKLIYYPKEASVQIENTTNMNWKNGRFYFDDMPLNAFINIVNQMNDSNIVLGSEVNKNALFTGSIRYNETLEDIADKVCFSLNLKKKGKKNNKIVIHN